MLRAAAQLVGSSASSPAVSKTARERLADLAEDVVDLAVGPDAKPLRDASFTMATVALGVYELAEALGSNPAATAAQARAMLGSILDARSAEDAVRLSHMLVAAEAVSAYHNTQQKTLAFLVPATSWKVTSADPHLTVEVATASGSAISGLPITASFPSTTAGRAASTASVDAFTPDGWDAYLVDLSALGLSRGSHTLELGVKTTKAPLSTTIAEHGGGAAAAAGSGDSSAYEIMPLIITVSVLPGKVLLQTAVVTVMQGRNGGAEGSVSLKTTAEYPEPMMVDTKPRHLLLTEKDSLSIHFAVRDENDDLISAQQAFLIFTHSISEQELAFVAKESESGTYSFDLDIGKMAESFRSVSADYRMDIVVGDDLMPAPVEWTLGLVQMSFKSNAGLLDRAFGWLGEAPDLVSPGYAVHLVKENTPNGLSVLFGVLAGSPLGVYIVMCRQR